MLVRPLLTVLLLLIALPVCASAAPASSPPALQMEPGERRFFALGVALARGAFAYAELAKGAKAVARTRSKLAQVGQLGKLEPTARRNRLEARDGVAQAEELMRALHAPPDALAPVSRAHTRLIGDLPLTSDAKPLAFFNGGAARTLSSLGEFDALSSLPEDPALRRWLDGAGVPRGLAVWYGEGEIAGLAQIAAAQQMPDLLPPAEQLATDLRGLRDWLALRLPDESSPEQAALQGALETFLADAARGARLGVRSHRPLTSAQLQALGDISRRLQEQVLGPGMDAPKTASRP